MQDLQFLNALYQVSEILNYDEYNLKERIPKQLISYIESNKSKDYNWTIDNNVSLEKQNLLQTTKVILTVLYREYICNNNEREELDRVLMENEIRYQNELKEKYNPDNIFKKRV